MLNCIVITDILLVTHIVAVAVKFTVAATTTGSMAARAIIMSKISLFLANF